jgi:ferredoxin-thioredoxin reductase catalytic subunit
MEEVTPQEIDEAYESLKRDAAAGGYRLNPDADFCKALVRGLLVNEKRYGYRSCPCRLASGAKGQDLDIICPCDYRDPDLTDYGACYCGLYVSREVAAGRQKLRSIPERRPPAGGAEAKTEKPSGALSVPLPVWRCRVCGYLCARDSPPEICPICKAGKERFERFL